MSQRSKLSRSQKNILIWFRGKQAQMEEEGGRIDEAGLPFHVGKLSQKQKTLSMRASVSRAMRAIEARGLIVRSRAQGKLYVRLTEVGREDFP